MINNKYPFYNQAYIADKSYDYFINKNNIGYIEEINDVLDFVIEDGKLYEDNFSDALNEAKQEAEDLKNVFGEYESIQEELDKHRFLKDFPLVVESMDKLVGAPLINSDIF